MILSESPGAQLRSHPHDPILLFLCFSFSVLLFTVSLFEIPTFDSHSLCICFSLIILNNYLIFSYFWADVTAFTTFIFLEKCQIPLSSVVSFFSPENTRADGLLAAVILMWTDCPSLSALTFASSSRGKGAHFVRDSGQGNLSWSSHLLCEQHPELH